MTLEFLAHAGVIHQLAMFICFPHLPISEYSMRNTGNRGIEAVHGAFWGGTTIPADYIPKFIVPTIFVQNE